MKCPSCSLEIPNDVSICPNCKVQIVRREIDQSKPKIKPPKDWRALILYTLGSKWFVIGIALLLLGEAAAMILTSSSYSPLGGYRDVDGDGHPANYDVAPNDPYYWAVGSGNIVLTINNPTNYASYHYQIFVNANEVLQGDINAKQTLIENIPVSFLIGMSSNYTVSLTLTLDGSSWFFHTALKLVDGQNTLQSIVLFS